MTDSHLRAVEITHPQGCDAEAAVIWLHGLGANGHDFEPVVPQLPVPPEIGIRYIFPHAPVMPVTINGGMAMPAWYDIKAIDIDRHVDEQQLLESARRVHDLTARERERGIASDHILVGGFSQGGAVAYQAALTFPEPLAGLFSLSSYLATAASLRVNSAQHQIPVLVCHGLQDAVVPEALGRQSVEGLGRLGIQAEYRTYTMEHSLCLEEVQDLGRFFTSVLSRRPTA